MSNESIPLLNGSKKTWHSFVCCSRKYVFQLTREKLGIRTNPLKIFNRAISNKHVKLSRSLEQRHEKMYSRRWTKMRAKLFGWHRTSGNGLPCAKTKRIPLNVVSYHNRRISSFHYVTMYDVIDVMSNKYTASDIEFSRWEVIYI